MALYGQLPAHSRFNLIARTPGTEVWRQAQARQLLYRLVRRPIFTQSDGVVGIHHDLPRLHQGRHTRRVTGIFDKHQEGGGVRHEAAMVGDTVGNGGHPELAHAVVDIVSGNVFLQGFRARPDGKVTWRQIRRAAQQFGQDRANRVQGVL